MQAPHFTQSYNRYAYCLNNPLIYTDPDGEFWHIIIGAVVGGVINLATNWDNIDNFWEGVASFSVGAGAGTLTALSGGATSGFWASSGAALMASSLGAGSRVAINNIVAQTGNGVGLGEVNWGGVGKDALYGVGGGLASASLDFIDIPIKLNKIKLPPIHLKFLSENRIYSNTLNHIIRSTVYNIGGNLATLQRPFKNFGKDFIGLNASMIMLAVVDASLYVINNTNIPNIIMNKYANNTPDDLSKIANEIDYQISEFNDDGLSDSFFYNDTRGNLFGFGTHNYSLPNGTTVNRWVTNISFLLKITR